MIRRRILAVSAFVLSVGVWPVHAQWTPPIGVPAPSFGINETARAVPSPWTAATAGFYYVDATHSASTDTSNPYGIPARPRKTIPNSLPAGAVVELHGVYDHAHTSPNNIVANGTAAQPIFIRGVSATAKPFIRAGWELNGSYVILENLEFGPFDNSRTGDLVMLAPIHHAAIRHSDLHGNVGSGGLGVVSWSSALTQHIVVYNNSIHDNGDVNATYDQDVHGISVGAKVSYLWVVDNQLYRNSGDGIQINAGSIAMQPTTHHIYVGRNITHHNKQTGMWAKQATDVIFTTNLCYSHRPSNSSMGQCMGYQYSTERIWFLYNHITDSEFGIGVGSNNDLGMGVDAVFVGNVIHNIHHSGANYNPYTAWGTAGIMLAGGQYAYVINNTIYDVDAGINVPFALSTLEVADNIIGQVTVAASNHIFIEDPGLASRLSMHHNLLSGSPRARLGGYQQLFTAAQLTAMSSISGSPAFLNEAGNDYRLQSSSPAIDRGEVTHPVYVAFQQLYGLSIARDPYGTAKPTGAAIDMGGLEFAGCGTSVCPVTSVRVTPASVSSPAGTAVTLTATATGGVNPIQYRFWRYSVNTSQWTLAQEYSSSPTYTWTPSALDVGSHNIQVWAKSAGSASEWEAWAGADVSITSAPKLRLISLTPSKQAIPTGSPMTWQATATGGIGPVLYKFWRYRASDGTWAILRDYSTSNVVTWTPLPSEVGTYSIQVWARSSSSSAEYESWLNTNPFTVIDVAPQILSFTPSGAFSSRVGVPIQWTVNAAAVGTPLQYKFWRLKAGAWTVVQDYSSANTYTWTPSASQVGTYQLQVWIRRTTSGAEWEDWAGTNAFTITP